MDSTCDSRHKAIISGIPNISRQKLMQRLKEVAKADDIHLSYITKSSAMVIFSNDADLSRLLASGLDVWFGEKLYHIVVKKVDTQSSNSNMPQPHRESASLSSFLYQPADKENEHILRYISRTPEHKQRLQTFLQQHHVTLRNISENEVEMDLIRDHCIDVSDNMYNRWIEEFLKGFTSWNEKLLNCSNDDGTYIIRKLGQYKCKCYGSWYPNTKTILVTGPSDVVEELKNEILWKMSQNEFQQSSSLVQFASAFRFSDVPPGVLRFVSKQRLQELRYHMKKFAYIHVATIDKITSVQVTPIPAMAIRSHSEFLKICTNELEKFFSQFQAWKQSYDSTAVCFVQQRQPDIFKESSDRDHHIKWFVDTGTVTVSGVTTAVQEYRQKIENLLKPSSQRQRVYSGSDKDADCSFDDIFTSPSQRSRHTSSSSNEGAACRPESAYYRLSYSTEDVPRQVLLFVLKDLKTKKCFEKCCLPNAKAVIRSEKVDGKDQVCVYANVLPMQHSDKVEVAVRKSIDEFFDQFKTQTKKYSKKKLKELEASTKDIFQTVTGETHVLYFPDSGTVKVTGVAAKVAEKFDEIERELDIATYIERVDNADVFIAQRECDVWNTVEKSCGDSGLRVSISSNQPGKIRFCGHQSAITKAREALGDLSENLFEKQLDGFSDGQISLLRSCEQSQKTYLTTRRNLLDAIYQNFKDNSAIGSIIFHDAHISLISTDEMNWNVSNNMLLQFLIGFSVNVGNAANLSQRKVYKTMKAKFINDAVFVRDMAAAKQLEIYCFASQKNEIMRKIKEVLEDARRNGNIQHFHEMSEEEARHFLNPHSQCKIYKVEKLEMEKRNAKYGLLVTCEKEDLDTVEMQLNDLLNEIISRSFHVPGYFLYECLQKSSRHLKIENEMNCSIFFQATKQTQREVKISIKHGNILDERCDAIINSTGQGLRFTSTSQVNKALKKKLGANVLMVISQFRKTLIQSRADVFKTGGMAPWSYIINVSTPNRSDALTKFVSELLEVCNDNQMQSLALPTIGTGNMGMDPNTVASCMKEAFEVYRSSPSKKYLKDIRVVVFDANLVPAFLSIESNSVPNSDGIDASIFANSSDKLNQAINMFKMLCSESVTKEVIRDPMVQEFSTFIKTQAKEICKGHDVHLEITMDIGQDECVLQGPIDEVRKVKEKIEKLLTAGPNWTPMTGKKPFEKVKLDSASSEYKAVKIKFKQSSPAYQEIIKIERIQNPLQYQQFRARRTLRLADKPTRDVIRQLFHGTSPENADAICLYGFNRTYAGMNGKMYGSGVYFHINASYSAQYSGYAGKKCMFLADVITGEYTKGSSDLKCAPVNPRTGESFDSVVDDISSPAIFVVFPDSSCYPSYLITFT